MLSSSEHYEEIHSDNKKSFNLKQVLQAIVFKFLERFLPRKTKRLVFMCTFIGCVKKINTPSKKVLSKINELLHVSDNDGAISLPMMFGCRLWESKLPGGVYLNYLSKPAIKLADLKDRNLSSAELRIVANTILASCPKWLVYDSKRVMRTDIISLISALPLISE